ncbi:hypothetical protein Ddye_001297 [Dipteronia dyeriana]|uniref:DUF382 domain-containing protein n=1 Tax=Dipteronia dyeriana TaxID=168575 RepID=A0AAD9XPL8_9ROSI|nr:hypothetical protein Ddye_001297 [Dipteronia dyeriana]
MTKILYPLQTERDPIRLGKTSHHTHTQPLLLCSSAFINSVPDFQCSDLLINSVHQPPICSYNYKPKPQLCSSVSICSTSDMLIRFAQPKAKASLPQRSICSSSPRPIYLNESKVWYVIAADPKLLVFLKAYRNTVPVLRHWCQKRKFLQGKRGIEKQPFQLPDFIAATGIAKIRQTTKRKYALSTTIFKLTQTISTAVRLFMICKMTGFTSSHFRLKNTENIHATASEKDRASTTFRPDLLKTEGEM